MRRSASWGASSRLTPTFRLGIGSGAAATMRTRALAPICLLALVAACTTPEESPPPARGDVPVSSPAATATGASFARIPDVIRAVEPSVVTIFTQGGLGSGVIYRDDGTIVTNEHVVRGSPRVQVAFADGQRVPGEVLAADPATDLAVVRVGRTDAPPAKFDTALPDVGELAIALGSPLGFEGTATAGIISGLSREIPGSAQTGTPLVDLIQTDAPISPGNSGGALVNADGEVVGINDAYIPPTAGAVSLGFAIPSATVVDVVDQLLETGKVSRAFVGIRPGRITPQVAEQLGLQRSEGVLVLDVVEGGPADNAGLQPGDVVTSVNGETVRSVEEFLGELRLLRPGQLVSLLRVRQGAEQSVRLALGEAPG
jgi:serine protease DegQ